MSYHTITDGMGGSTPGRPSLPVNRFTAHFTPLEIAVLYQRCSEEGFGSMPMWDELIAAYIANHPELDADRASKGTT